MADAVTSQTIQDGERLAILKFTNISDGTGESAVVKVDVSALASSATGRACNGVKILKIWAQTYGMGVDVLWDATTDVVCETIPADVMYRMKYDEFGGIPNNAGSGVTGDVSFTTVGAASGDRYTIILECIKTYAAAQEFYMANVKITDLAAGGAVSSSDPFESVQAGTSVQVTAAQIKTFANLTPAITVTNNIPRFITYPILSVLATSGTDSACTNGNIYWASVYIPHSCTITGIKILNGTVAGTDSVIVALYDNAGTLLANSSLSGTVTSGAVAFQSVPFTATEDVVGPSYCYIAVQFNGTTDRFRTIPSGNVVEYTSVCNSTTGTFGTLPSLTVGTTFVANQGPIAVTY